MSARAGALAAILLAAPIAAAPRDPFAGRVAGPPERCIPLRTNQGGTVIDRNTIVYQGDRGRVWRAIPAGPCPALQPLTTLVVEVFGGQICRNDRFTVLQPGTVVPAAPCRFGSFIPYSRRR